MNIDTVNATGTTDRCPACRARLGLSPVCGRCGTDFVMTRHAQVQAKQQVTHAIRQLLGGQPLQAAASVRAAWLLDCQPLARVVSRMIERSNAA